MEEPLTNGALDPLSVARQVRQGKVGLERCGLLGGKRMIDHVQPRLIIDAERTVVEVRRADRCEQSTATAPDAISTQLGATDTV